MNADEVNDWMVAICPASGGEVELRLPGVAAADGRACVFTRASDRPDARVSIDTSGVEAEVSSCALIRDQSRCRLWF